MLHIVVVAIVEPVLHIAVLPGEGCRDIVKLLFGHFRVQTMDFHLKADESVFGIVDLAHRFLDGLDAGSRRTEHHGELACFLRLRQVAVDAVTTVGAYLQQIHVCLVSAIGIYLFAVHMQVRLASLFKVRFPEFVKILRILRVGLQQFWRESHFHVMLILLVGHRGCQPQIEESRLFHRAHVDGRPSVLQSHLAFAGGWHLVGTYLITHLHVLWYTILAEGDFHLRLLSHLI